MRNKLLLFAFIFPFLSFSQDKFFKGKIVVPNIDLEGVLVINLTKEIQVLTNSIGEFSIRAEPDDLLIFSSIFLNKKRHLVEKEDFLQQNIIEMEVLPYEIETVDINRIIINVEDLGIVPKGQKRYTVAERRLYTAGQLSIGTSIGIDAIINAISGRTKMLKKIVEIERENKNVAIITDIFSKDFFIKTLKIRPENIEEFKYYALYYIEKNLSIKEKENYFKKISKEELEFKLISLSKSYLKLKEIEE